MKESATAALSYLRSKAEQLGINPNFLEKTDLHLHFPAGSIPKDGPSAGVTILTALTSLLTGIRVRHDTAMTGEATLRGLVLPVGGIKEKVLAAHRAGIKRVILPERCRKDLIDVPDQARNELEFIFVTHMDEVLKAALETQPVPTTSGTPGGEPTKEAPLAPKAAEPEVRA
jgi:ATP-dependent Lon protease